MLDGVWLGANERTEEQLVGTKNGVTKCRTRQCSHIRFSFFLSYFVSLALTLMSSISLCFVQVGLLGFWPTLCRLGGAIVLACFAGLAVLNVVDTRQSIILWIWLVRVCLGVKTMCGWFLLNGSKRMKKPSHSLSKLHRTASWRASQRR